MFFQQMVENLPQNTFLRGDDIASVSQLEGQSSILCQAVAKRSMVFRDPLLNAKPYK